LSTAVFAPGPRYIGHDADAGSAMDLDNVKQLQARKPSRSRAPSRCSASLV